MQARALETFQGLSGQLAVLGFLHSLWIGLVVFSGVAAAFQAWPRLSHRSRHATLLAALFLVAAFPPVVVALHHAQASLRPASAQSGALTTVIFGAAGNDQTRPSIFREPANSVQTHSNRESRHLALIALVLSRSITAIHRFRSFVVVAWLVGSIALAGLLALGARAVWRICAEARPAPPAIRESAATLAQRAGLKTTPRVMIHPQLSEPCLCGLFRPLILLPELWLSCGHGKRLEAILAHELAHARRLDHLVNLAQRLIEVALFFNPAVHWLSCSLRRQREFCADALAVRLTGDPLALAEALEAVARLRLTSPVRPPLGAALGGQTISLLSRIQELIGMTPSRPKPRLWPFAALPAAGFLALVAVGIGSAQDQVGAGAGASQVPPGVTSDGGSGPFSIKNHGPKPDRERLNRQICYEIRYLSLDANPWREAVKDHLNLIKQEVDVCCWLIDDKSIGDVLNLAQSDITANVLQAPKTTTFENVHTLLSHTYVQRYVSQLEKVETTEHLGFRPIVKECELGSRIDVVGSFAAVGTAITVELRDSSLLNLHTLVRRETFHNQNYAGEYQVPTTVVRSCRVSCDVSDNSALVISLGMHERRGRLSDAGETASGILQAVGLPPVPARPVACERLVMIKPRRIVLPADEGAGAAIKGFFNDAPRTR
jgi:beta-lactamase regulating signal transducer with metallopeptidase domain